MSDHSQWLRGLAEKGGKGVVNNIDARCLGRIADEIDHLRPYVDAFRREEDRADKLGRDVDELREQLVRKDAALNHARVRFECLTDYFEEIADETMQAMSSVDADRMIAALTDEQQTRTIDSVPSCGQENDYRRAQTSALGKSDADR